MSLDTNLLLDQRTADATLGLDGTGGAVESFESDIELSESLKLSSMTGGTNGRTFATSVGAFSAFSVAVSSPEGFVWL